MPTDARHPADEVGRVRIKVWLVCLSIVRTLSRSGYSEYKDNDIAIIINLIERINKAYRDGGVRPTQIERTRTEQRVSGVQVDSTIEKILDEAHIAHNWTHETRTFYSNTIGQYFSLDRQRRNSKVMFSLGELLTMEECKKGLESPVG